jgi:hypothetical protein
MFELEDRIRNFVNLNALPVSADEVIELCLSRENVVTPLARPHWRTIPIVFAMSAAVLLLMWTYSVATFWGSVEKDTGVQKTALARDLSDLRP